MGTCPHSSRFLADLDEHDVDRIVVGGDVVPGPMPRECLTRLLDVDIPIQFISGNGEREVLAIREGREPRGLNESEGSDAVLERLNRKARMLGKGAVAVHHAQAGFAR